MRTTFTRNLNCRGLVRARRCGHPGLGPLVGDSPDGGDDFLDGGRGKDPLDGDSGVEECVNGEQAINCEA